MKELQKLAVKYPYDPLWCLVSVCRARQKEIDHGDCPALPLSGSLTIPKLTFWLCVENICTSQGRVHLGSSGMGSGWDNLFQHLASIKRGAPQQRQRASQPAFRCSSKSRPIICFQDDQDCMFSGHDVCTTHLTTNIPSFYSPQ